RAVAGPQFSALRPRLVAQTCGELPEDPGPGPVAEPGADPEPVAVAGDDSRLMQYPQMMRDALLATRHLVRERADGRPTTRRQLLDQSDPRRIGEDTQHRGQ